MTAKEKAEQLFDNINIHIPIEASFSHTGKQAFSKITIDHLATKKIALIMVNEIIEALRKDLAIFTLLKGFWQEVKKEIEYM
jgi:hypothetical protein